MTDTNPTPPLTDTAPAADSAVAAPAPAAEPAPAPAAEGGEQPKPFAKFKGEQDKGVLFEKPKEGEGESKEGEPAPEGEKKESEGEEKPAPDYSGIVTPDEDFVAPEFVEEFKAFAAEKGLAPEVAKAVFDEYVKHEEAKLDFWLETKANWRKEVESDPVIGGENLSAATGKINDLVRSTFERHGEEGAALLDEFQNDLILLGLGNKRSFVRFMHYLAEDFREDSVGGTRHASNTKLPPEKVLYPNMA